MSKNWSKEEIKLLEKHYPVLGTKCSQFIKDRSLSSIEHKASRLGIKYQVFEGGKEGYLDIETSQLDGDFGYMYSWVIKTKGIDEYKHGIITKEEIMNGTLDKRVVQELVNTLGEYRRIYTYYGTRFDIAFSRTRALANNIDFLPYGLVEHRDLWFLAKRILKLSRYRLDNVCNILGIEGKTHLDPKIWVRANTGNEESLKYILEHNIADCEILEKAHIRLREYEARTRRYM